MNKKVKEMNSIKKRLSSLQMQIFIFILLLFTACEADEINPLIELESEPDTEIQYAVENFNLSVLLEAEDPEVRSRANSLSLKVARAANVVFTVIPTDLKVLPASGYEITVIASGTFTGSIPIRASVFPDGPLIAQETILGNGLTGGSRSMTIPAHFDKNGSSRYIMIEYYDNDLGLWPSIDAYGQEAYPMLFESNIGDNIPQTGNTYTITQLGDFPSVFPEMARFRAVTTNDVLISGSSLIAPPSKTTPITIAENRDDLPRMVYLQFWIDEMGEWITFETTLQLGTGTSSNVITLSKVELCGIEPTGGYIHVYVWGNPTELNAGDQIPIRIKGFSNVLLTTTTIVEGTAIWGATLPNLYPHASTGYHGSTVLEIPSLENNGWGAYYHLNLDQRYTPYISWTFEYYDGEQWRELTPTFGQNNYFLGVNNTATTLTAGGGYWNLLVTGSFPAGLIVFRAVNEFNTVISNANITLPASAGGNQATLVPISISPNNTGSTRYVYLEYSINGGAFTKWHKGINPTPYWSGNNYIIQTN